MTAHRSALSSTAMLLALALPAVAAAQSQAPAAAAQTEEIVVTGSRIARPEIELPTPVQSISAVQLQRTGNDSIGTLLAQQPALSFSGSPQAQQQRGAAGTRGEFTGGMSLADLRGLGANRTLTLINGKRTVGSDPGNAAVDLNSVSPSLISRIEIITGGASAVYGSDAVSGVVNLILKQDYEGAEVTIKGSRPVNGNYGTTYGVSGTVGTNFADRRGNIVLSVDLDRTNRVGPEHIKERQNYGLVLNPLNKGPNDGIPDALLVPGYSSEQITYSGTIGVSGNTNGVGPIAFDSQGRPGPLPTRVLQGTSSTFGTFNGNCLNCFKLEDFYLNVPPLDRATVNTLGHFDLTDYATVYGEFAYGGRKSKGLGQPVLRLADTINVAQNPYLDASVRQRLLAAGVGTVTLQKAYDEFSRSSEVQRDTYRGIGGIKGKFDTQIAPFNYDASYSYGRTNVRYLGFNRLYAANLLAALDSVVDPRDGQIKCRMNVPSAQPAGYVMPAVQGGGTCAPLNPFGLHQTSAAAGDFMRVTTDSKAWLTQTVVGGTFGTDSSKFLTLPGGGAISLAGGYEYRKETAGARWDNRLKTPVTTQIGTQTDYDAKYDVTEFFGETSIPLLTKLPFAELLSIEGAIRIADYSHAGKAQGTKLGAIWAPISDFRFRATTARAVRAPNITEGFQPTQLTTSTIGDPCGAGLINNNVNRAANCAALGRPAGYSPSTGNLALPIATSGNPALTPEKSTSLTIGGVVTPSFLPGFSASLDWYRIKIRDAISFITAQQIADNCVNSAGGPDQAFCSLLTRVSDRNATNYFNITTGRTTYVNAAKLMTSGFDMQLSYSRPMLDGFVTATAAATYLKKLNNYPFQANPNQVTIIGGTLGYPRKKGNLSVTYDRDDWAFTWGGRYVGKQDLFDRSPGANLEQQDIQYAPGKFYNDLYFEYRREQGPAKLTFYIGVTNVLNVRPPIIEASQGSAGTAFDELGPVAFAGIKAKF